MSVKVTSLYHFCFSPTFAYGKECLTCKSQKLVDILLAEGGDPCDLWE